MNFEPPLPTKLPKGFKPCTSPLPGQYAFRGPGHLIVMVGADWWDDQHWLHVSLSYQNRLPSYGDLRRVKKIFIGPGKKAIQVFPDEAEHVDIHPCCLHLWHRLDGDDIPDFTKGMGTI